MKQLVQHSTDTGGHGYHHEEQEQRGDDAGGALQPLDAPGHQQSVHIGALGHLRQPHEQDADDGEQHSRSRKAHIAPVAEVAEKLPQFLSGDESRAQKASHICEGQRPHFDFFHTSYSLPKNAHRLSVCAAADFVNPCRHFFLLNHSVFIDAVGGAVYNCPRKQSACTGISFDPGGITFLEEENP